MTTTMEIYPTKTEYFDDWNTSIRHVVKMSEELGDEQYYKNLMKSNYHQTNENEMFGFARICYLYKTEYKSYVNKLERKLKVAVRLGQMDNARKNKTKLDAICHSIEARHNRLVRATIIHHHEDDFEVNDLVMARQAMKNYTDFEKAARFAINGNGAKVDKYVKKMNENLTDTWCILTDKSERNEDFHTTKPDGTKLKNGGAFAVILDAMADDIKLLKKFRAILC